mmetsp:Transcript_21641/g.44547  ORF Transcript_21641/g.44547 Transcript_21641/m.44547 type:complete len:886 (-) Transcript_21641:158-2815(-)
MVIRNGPFARKLGLINLVQLSFSRETTFWHSTRQQHAVSNLRSSSVAQRQLQTNNANYGLSNNYDDDLHFHETTFLASHNAHANRDEADNFLEALGINQENSIYKQLKDDGVRSLSLDLNVINDNLTLVHGPLDYGGLTSQLETHLVPFLEEETDAIVTLDFQTIDGQSEQVLEGLKAMLSTLTVNNITLANMTFRYNDERWSTHSDWPTLAEIRSSNQRVFIFTDKSEIVDYDYGIVFKPFVFQENDWQGIEECIERYAWGVKNLSVVGKESWTRLYFMNHFCCETGSESYPRVVGEDLIGGGDNGWGILYPRIEECMATNGGMKPNYISVDWVGESPDVLEIADYLKFGGALGTGQTCTDDAHCATSSCNLAFGLCQCQICSGDDEEICPGCLEQEVCISPGDDQLNKCTQKDLTSDSFYCGTNYFETLETCNDRKRCPNGNNDCTNGEVCFAGIDCTPPPTLTPTDSPSDLPSIKPSMMPSVSPSDGGSSAPTVPNRNFCGPDYFTTLQTCLESTPCPEPFGDDICVPLGLACFANIDCPRPPSTSAPTATPTSSQAPSISLNQANTTAPSLVMGGSMLPTATILGLIIGGSNSTDSSNSTDQSTTPPITTSIPTSNPPSTAPSLSPTKAPTPAITRYCGTSYDEAREYCNALRACPRGFECPSDMTCYNGIRCFTSAPTDSPSWTPTKSLPPTTSSSMPPTTEPPVSPTASPTSRPTKAPFDFSNQFFCGGNYTHAKENCYYNTPCPGGIEEVCPDGETCFGGIYGCTAPPTLFPTSTPSQTPSAGVVTPVDPNEVGGDPNSPSSPNGTPSQNTSPSGVPPGGSPGNAIEDSAPTPSEFSARPTWGNFDLQPINNSDILAFSSLMKVAISISIICFAEMLM